MSVWRGSTHWKRNPRIRSIHSRCLIIRGWGDAVQMYSAWRSNLLSCFVNALAILQKLTVYSRNSFQKSVNRFLRNQVHLLHPPLSALQPITLVITCPLLFSGPRRRWFLQRRADDGWPTGYKPGAHSAANWKGSHLQGCLWLGGDEVHHLDWRGVWSKFQKHSNCFYFWFWWFLLNWNHFQLRWNNGGVKPYFYQTHSQCENLPLPQVFRWKREKTARCKTFYHYFRFHERNNVHAWRAFHRFSPMLPTMKTARSWEPTLNTKTRFLRAWRRLVGHIFESFESRHALSALWSLNVPHPSSHIPRPRR